jgi:hypothetical protein
VHLSVSDWRLLQVSGSSSYVHRKSGILFSLDSYESNLNGLQVTNITTGIATVAEILAYYIPFIDHLLDTISIPLATVAGSLLFASQFAELGTFPQWALALIAGGGTAATISTGFAGIRAFYCNNGRLGNSVVGTTETAGAGIMSVLAMACPLLQLFCDNSNFSSLFTDEKRGGN